jgi:RIO-like serine/threonine protein kinase
VEIIKFNGHLAIRKTYKAGRERYAEREALAFRELSKKQPAVPPLLASGANYVVTPYYEDILRGKTDSQRRLYLRNYRERIVDFMRFLYNEGFFLIDFRPQSVLVTTEGDLRVVDFEFLYKYVKKPATFLQSYDIAGVPRDFRGDLPRGHRPMRSWRFQWKGIFRARDLRAAEARR